MDTTNIMVVEDSGIVLLDIKKSLKALGYSVVATASSKDEAIRKAGETRPHLVLMDIRLGEEMGGIEAADHIREHFNIPIVFLTGYADEDTFQRAKITDPFGYILKPFDPKGLRTTIEIAIHNHGLKSKLRESGKRYRTLVETMKDGVGQVDADGKMIFVNDALCKMLDLTQEELLGRDHESLFPEEQRKLQQEEFENRKVGESNSFETVLSGKDGQLIPVILSGSPVFNDSGDFVSTIGVFTDITERKQAELNLKESEGRFRVIFDTEPECVKILDPDTTLVTMNAAGLAMIDAESLDMVKGQSVLPIVDEEFREDFRKLTDNVCQKGQTGILKFRITGLKGSIRWLESHAVPLRTSDSDVTRLLSVTRDITEQKQTEEALRESELLYHDLVETAQDLIWQCDREGRYIYLNPAWEDVFGYKIDEMLGRFFADFQSPDYKTRDTETFSSLLKGIFITRYETVHLTKDGREVYLVFNAKAVRDEQGNIIGTRGTAYDITERKQNEMALQKSQYLLEESQKLAKIGHYDLDIPKGLWESSDSLNGLFGIDRNYPTDVAGWLKITHPDEQTEMSNYFATQVLEKRQDFDKEYRIVRVDNGETRWVHGLGKLEFDEKGAPIRMIGSIQDITERKRAEERIQESEKRFRSIVESSPLGMHMYELKAPDQLVFSGSNPAADKILGIDNAQFIGKTIEEAFPALVNTEVPLRYMESAVNGNPWKVEQIDYDTEGIKGAFEVNAFQTSSNKMVAMFQDITQRKRAVEALRNSEERYRAVVENQTEFIVRWKPDGVRTFVNEAYLRYYDLTLDEALSSGFLPLIVEEDRNMVEEKISRLVSGAVPSETDTHRVIRPDGSIGWQEWTDHAIYDEKGDIVEFQSVGRDITDRKQAEETVRLKTEELESLFSISSHLRSAQSADDMLPVVLSEMRRVLRSDAGAVILLDADGEYFTYALGDGQLAVNNGIQFDVEKSISGWVLQTREPYLTEDLSAEQKKPTKLKGDENLGPAAFVPVISESEFLGVLVCARNKESNAQSYSSSEVQLLVAIGEMVGNALRRARLFDQALTRLQNVQALHSIDMAISANMDLSVMLDVLLAQGSAQLGVEAACVLLLNQHTHALEHAASLGFRTKAVKTAQLRVGEGLPGQVALKREVLHEANLQKSEILLRKNILDEGFVSYLAAPLVAKGQLQGVLEIFSRTKMSVNDEQIGFLETLATQAAIAIDNAQLFSNLQRSNFELEMAYDATIEGWSRALELRDQETEGHTLRVTDMTIRLAQAMGIRSAEIVHIRRGALLHDIGKMGVPDRILLKPGELTPKEWKVMQQHTDYAFEMLWPIEFLRPAIDIPHYHHERWDGTGYPRQLKGEQIPLPARLFAVVDVWDALTSKRPYRVEEWPEEKALDYIISNKEKHFDPRAVEVFLDVHSNIAMDNGSVRKK